jgi:hypothetical protein
MFWSRRLSLKMFHVLQALIKYEDWNVTVLAKDIKNLIRLSLVSLLVTPDPDITGRALSSIYV